LAQRTGVLSQLHAVGAERQVFETFQRIQARRQFRKIMTCQRLAAGEAHAVNAEFGEGA